MMNAKTVPAGDLKRGDKVYDGLGNFILTVSKVTKIVRTDGYGKVSIEWAGRRGADVVDINRPFQKLL